MQRICPWLYCWPFARHLHSGPALAVSANPANPSAAAKIANVDVLTPCSGHLNKLQIDGLWSAPSRIFLHFEADFQAFAEFRNARALNGSDMDEHILAAIFRRNEPISLRLIEELHSAILAHGKIMRRGQR